MEFNADSVRCGWELWKTAGKWTLNKDYCVMLLFLPRMNFSAQHIQAKTPKTVSYSKHFVSVGCVCPEHLSIWGASGSPLLCMLMCVVWVPICCFDTWLLCKNVQLMWVNGEKLVILHSYNGVMGRKKKQRLKKRVGNEGKKGEGKEKHMGKENYKEARREKVSEERRRRGKGVFIK